MRCLMLGSSDVGDLRPVALGRGDTLLVRRGFRSLLRLLVFGPMPSER